MGRKQGDEKAGGKFAAGERSAHEDEIWLNEHDIKKLEGAFKRNMLPIAAVQVMSAKAGVGWTSGSHTALPVLSTSEGVGAEAFTGLLDNTDIAKRLKALYE